MKMDPSQLQGLSFWKCSAKAGSFLQAQDRLELWLSIALDRWMNQNTHTWAGSWCWGAECASEPNTWWDLYRWDHGLWEHSHAWWGELDFPGLLDQQRISSSRQRQDARSDNPAAVFHQLEMCLCNRKGFLPHLRVASQRNCRVNNIFATLERNSAAHD